MNNTHSVFRIPRLKPPALKTARALFIHFSTICQFWGIKINIFKNWGPRHCLGRSGNAYGLSCYDCDITTHLLVPSAFASGTNSTCVLSEKSVTSPEVEAQFSLRVGNIFRKRFLCSFVLVRMPTNRIKCMCSPHSCISAKIQDGGYRPYWNLA